MTNPKALSIFSGLGGMDLGFESAGFEIVACLDIDPLAKRALQLNRKQRTIIENGDVSHAGLRLTPQHFGLTTGDLDILVGAPPCQPFSKAAQWTASGRSGMSDSRANCMTGWARLVAGFLPRVIVLENVTGFVEGETSALDILQAHLDEINATHGTAYEVGYRIIDAADIGVPQRRKRAIVVAARDRESVPWPALTHHRSPMRAWDALASALPSVAGPSGKWGDLLATIPEGSNYQWHTERGGGERLFGYRTRYWSFLMKLAKDQPAWTLSANPGPATGPFHWDNRPLSVTEMLRLQSFPPSWKVPGTRREQVRLVGNATPPLLAEVLARALGEQLFGKRYAGRPKFLLSRKRNVPPPQAVKPLPDAYKALVGEHPPHPGAGKGPSPRSRDDNL